MIGESFGLARRIEVKFSPIAPVQVKRRVFDSVSHSTNCLHEDAWNIRVTILFD